jgi:hypothetical protein
MREETRIMSNTSEWSAALTRDVALQWDNEQGSATQALSLAASGILAGLRADDDDVYVDRRTTAITAAADLLREEWRGQVGNETTGDPDAWPTGATMIGEHLCTIEGAIDWRDLAGDYVDRVLEELQNYGEWPAGVGPWPDDDERAELGTWSA